MGIPVILPEGFYEKDGHYCGPKDFETNGTLELLEYYSVVGLSDTGKEKACIKCRFNVSNRTFRSDIPIDDLNPKKISRHIPDNFRLLNEAKNEKAIFVIDCLNRTIFNMEPAQKILLNQGYNETPDGLQYVIGDQIITEHNPGKYIVESEFQSKKIYEKKSIMGITNDFLSLGGSTAALFIAALVPCTNPLLKQIKPGYDLGFSTIIKGSTGTGKTTIAKILTGFYENGCNVTSLSSEKEAVFTLSHFKDSVVLIDDLYKTDSDRVNASNYSKLIPILHQKNSTGAIRYKGKSVRIDSSLFVTAEYLPKNASTINRCFIVELESMPNKSILSRLTQQQDNYIYCVYSFIRWICNNFSDLVRTAEDHWSILEKNDRDYDEEEFMGLSRILQCQKVLKLTCALFMEFLKETQIAYPKHLKKYEKQFNDSIDECISGMLDRIKINSDEMSYTDLFIYTLSQCDNIAVAKSYKKYRTFKGHRLIGYEDDEKEYNPKYTFFEYEESNETLYCVTGGDLVNFLRFGYEKLYDYNKPNKMTFSKKSVSKDLLENGLLKMCGKEKTYRLNDESDRTKYYHLRENIIVQLKEIHNHKSLNEINKLMDNAAKKDS